MPKVTVVIPVYNTEKYLRKCLDSVTNQTLSDIEIICVNDCSTDNSLEILKEFAQNDKRIKIIDLPETHGAGYARNRGIETAKGEYIGFIDSDDFVDFDFYELLYNCAKNDCADIVKGSVYNYKSDTDKRVREDIVGIIQNKTCFNMCFPSAIYSEKLIKKHSLCFLEDCIWGEDRLFLVKAVHFAKKCGVVGYTHYYYVRRDDSATKNINYQKIESAVFSNEKIFEFINNANIKEKDYENLAIVFLEDVLHVILTGIQAGVECSALQIRASKIFETIKNKEILKQNRFMERYKYLKDAKYANFVDAINREKKKEDNKKVFDSLREKMLRNQDLAEETTKSDIISVIIPVYNAEKYLTKCLESVVSQTYQNLEIICINDGSSDKSLEILNKYKNSDNRIKIINFEENKGASIARNAGLNVARGKYIGFVDSDDYIDAEFYEKLYLAIKNTNFGYVRSKNVKYFEKENKYVPIKLYLFWGALYNRDFLKENNINFIPNIICAEDQIFMVKCEYYSDTKSVDVNYYYRRHEDASVFNKVKTKKQIISDMNGFDRCIDFLVSNKIENGRQQKLLCKTLEKIFEHTNRLPIECKDEYIDFISKCQKKLINQEV